MRTDPLNAMAELELRELFEHLHNGPYADTDVCTFEVEQAVVLTACGLGHEPVAVAGLTVPAAYAVAALGADRFVLRRCAAWTN